MVVCGPGCHSSTVLFCQNNYYYQQIRLYAISSMYLLIDVTAVSYLLTTWSDIIYLKTLFSVN